jgi:hypothetical protein
MEPVKIKLSQAIPAHGGTTDELLIPPPMAKHLRKLPAVSSIAFGQFLDMLADVTGLPPSSIDRRAAADAIVAVEALSNFLQPPADGASVSS